MKKISRSERRQEFKQINIITANAKQAMAKWIESLGYIPDGKEVSAWQVGYIAGINNSKKD